ncbi:LON peptidase substrate-binding domain-containing protein [Iamia majanohamensis]|uniref:LON peptidase substrate-binding domain-containing protein n=1 Tax=Iamia majanohamensis TaxID=467976 RepID=A0AAE9Y9D9_9ACTN|nr:LON peptidase substrate-binding domain-containing protein [Iamia majanohamensis]WCO69195.1 LON peptidase substrate-binding domain-containing protein [Iamia majanohamensis]
MADDRPPDDRPPDDRPPDDQPPDDPSPGGEGAVPAVPPSGEAPPEAPLPEELVALEADLLGDDDGALPMFPLGSVLVPSMVLPLHVFEHRYRRLVRDCLSTEPEFGVVLIERGREVGGGDVRSDVGTVARIVEGAELPDGRFALQSVGTRRIRVLRWLDDAPYPRALVEDWPDEPDPQDADPGARRDDAVALLRRGLVLQLELGEPAPDPDIELSDDPEVASHQVAALAPIGPHDRQRLLVAPSTVARLELATTLLVDAVEMLEVRKEMG